LDQHGGMARAATKDITGRQRVPLKVVFGGGGAVGIAWHVAVIEAGLTLGLPMRSAPAIGTSAGAWACGAARMGLGFEEFAAIGDVAVPNRSSGLLEGIARQLFGDVRLPDVRISVVQTPSMRRHLLDASRFDFATLVGASSAVPGLFAPQKIGAATFVDGGVRSMASADAASPADLLIASLPIAGPLYGPMGRTLERNARNALATWRKRHGGTTIVLRPGKRIADAVGSRPLALMDTELARALYPLAYDTAIRRLEKRLEQIERSTTPLRMSNENAALLTPSMN
jgi:predicted acylesterase/phospholipase RssA